MKKFVLVLRHPKVEGEGNGGATEKRGIRSGLSEEGKRQLEEIIHFLKSFFPPSSIITGRAPRYYGAARTIASNFNNLIEIDESVEQAGKRNATGHERVKLLVQMRKRLKVAIGNAPDHAVIITSNPFLEACLHEKGITLKEMEKHRQDFRTNPGNGILFNEKGKQIARINIFW